MNTIEHKDVYEPQEIQAIVASLNAVTTGNLDGWHSARSELWEHTTTGYPLTSVTLRGRDVNGASIVIVRDLDGWTRSS